jgi:hypothetical protein
MAISQSFVFDPATGATVDTRSMESGWHGLHGSLREAALYEAFSATGTIAVGSAAVATPSASPIPFNIVARQTDGTTSVVATGQFPANAYQADAAALNLDVSTFVNALPSTSYAVVPAGTVSQSQVRPGYYSWLEAPADGSGFVLSLVISVA